MNCIDTDSSYEQIYVNKFNNLDEIENLLKEKTTKVCS